MNMNVHILRSSNSNPNFLSRVFVGATANPYPTLSQLILVSPKGLRTFLDPKTLKFHHHFDIFLQSGFRVSLGTNSICIGVCGLVELEKEPCEWVVVTKALGLSQEHYLTIDQFSNKTTKD